MVQSQIVKKYIVNDRSLLTMHGIKTSGRVLLWSQKTEMDLNQWYTLIFQITARNFSAPNRDMCEIKI